MLVQLNGKDFTHDDSGGRLVLRGSLAARRFSLYHPKLSATDIEVRSGQLDFVATLGRAAVSLDAGSRLVVNQLVLHPEISVRLKPSKAASIRVTSDETPANAFFASLPPGIFDALQGTEGSGTLQYHLSASVDMAQVDSLKFDSSLTGRNFRITRFGAEDLSQLNREFLYTAYNDRGDSLRTFPVGLSNPDFTPYEENFALPEIGHHHGRRPALLHPQGLHGAGVCAFRHPEPQGTPLCAGRLHHQHAAGEKRVSEPPQNHWPQGRRSPDGVAD